MRVYVDIDPTDIIMDLSHEDAVGLIKDIDFFMEDWNFTEEMARYFLRSLKNFYSEYPDAGSIEKLLKSLPE